MINISIRQKTAKASGFFAILLASLAFFTPPHAVAAENEASNYKQCFAETSSSLCYTVQPGDTLWAIAEHAYGSGFRWSELQFVDSTGTNHKPVTDPRKLPVGSIIRIQGSKIMQPEYRITDYNIVSPVGNTIVSRVKANAQPGDAMHNYHAIFINREFFDGWYRDISHMEFSQDGKHLSYVAGQREKQFIVDGVKNPHLSVGCDWKLLTYSNDGSHYAIRNSVTECGSRRHTGAPEQFLVLSDIGNGPSYHYLDNVRWTDDGTLTYRAHIDDQWRLVINHEDQQIYDYIDRPIIAKNGTIAYIARQGEEWFMVIDGEEQQHHRYIENSGYWISPDGRLVGYKALNDDDTWTDVRIER